MRRLHECIPCAAVIYNSIVFFLACVRAFVCVSPFEISFTRLSLSLLRYSSIFNCTGLSFSLFLPLSLFVFVLLLLLLRLRFVSTSINTHFSFGSMCMRSFLSRLAFWDAPAFCLSSTKFTQTRLVCWFRLVDLLQTRKEFHGYCVNAILLSFIFCFCFVLLLVLLLCVVCVAVAFLCMLGFLSVLMKMNSFVFFYSFSWTWIKWFQMQSDFSDLAFDSVFVWSLKALRVKYFSFQTCTWKESI